MSDPTLYLLIAVAVATPGFVGACLGGWAGFFASLFYYAALVLCLGALTMNPAGAIAGFLAATATFAIVCWSLLDRPLAK